MGNEPNLRDPEIEFDYISDKILWEKILGDFYPLDINDPDSTEIKLGYYFRSEMIQVRSTKDNSITNQKRALFPEESFFYDTDQDRCESLGLLCDILVRFKKPVIGIFIEIPEHPSVEKRVDFSPIQVYFKEDYYPTLNSNRNRMEILFNEKDYFTLYKYCFNKEADLENSSRTLLFNFACFRGFLLA